MEVLTNDNWLLTVGTFLPLVGVVVMMFVPGVEERLHKQIAILTAAATTAVGIVTLIQFDYGQAEKLQFVADESLLRDKDIIAAAKKRGVVLEGDDDDE